MATENKSPIGKVGDTADKAVHLKMEGGYGQDYLVPGKPADGQPGVLLVQEGDVITRGAVARFKRAQGNAKRLNAGNRRTRG